MLLTSASLRHSLPGQYRPISLQRWLDANTEIRAGCSQAASSTETNAAGYMQIFWRLYRHILAKVASWTCSLPLLNVVDPGLKQQVAHSRHFDNDDGCTAGRRLTGSMMTSYNAFIAPRILSGNEDQALKMIAAALDWFL